MGSDSTDTIEVQNVVGVADLGHEFDLATVAMDLEGSDYNPDQFPGLLYQVENPHATVMTFRSGKVTITGAVRVSDVQAAFDEYVATLRDISIPVTDTSEAQIVNIVADADLGEVLNLNAIAIGLGLERIEYEPEQFPGLVYRLEEPKVVILLFSSGKLVITGATDRQTIRTAVETVVMRLTDLSLLGD